MDRSFLDLENLNEFSTLSQDSEQFHVIERDLGAPNICVPKMAWDFLV